MKKQRVILAFLMIPFYANAQTEKSILRGHITDKESHRSLSDVQLFLPKLKLLYSADSQGYFEIRNLPYGAFSVHVLQANELLDSFRVAISQPLIDIGDIGIAGYASLPTNNFALQDAAIPVVAIEADQNNLDDEGIINNQNVSVLLRSAGSRDPFLNAASFVFGQYNFHTRGYNRSAQQIYINGILMNDLTTGAALWANWGGLNDVFRNQNSTYGLEADQEAIGGLNGSINYGIGANEQSPQTKLSYSISNRSYTNRIMFSHNTGINKKGWAYSFAVSRRWAQEVYVPGTSFDAYAGYASVSRTLNNTQQLTLSIIASQSTRARSGAATAEVYALADDHYYNANWGWQDGIKRNAKTASVFQPIAILQHQYKSQSGKTQISTAVSYQCGRNANNSLDWYNAVDPRPDYYRNLPSYYRTTNPTAANNIKQSLRENPDQLQINWNRLYNANRTNVETLYGVNGHVGDSLNGIRSLYVLGADVERISKVSLASTLQHKISEALSISGGIQAIHQNSAFFRELKDLLGGQYFLNRNMFATQQYAGNNSFAQNDLNTPDRAVLTGEKYRYYYTNTSSKTWSWAQLELNRKRFSFFVAASAGVNTYIRNGLYRNGLFPENSFGKSNAQVFPNYTTKGGITYKLNGRNYFVVNGFYRTEDAGVNNIFISPRMRNQTIEHPELQRTRSIEAAYFLRTAKWNVRSLVYATDILNATSIQRFYNDDPEYQSFVNFVMRKVNSKFIGTEFAAEYALNTQLSLSAAASVGQAFYTNLPSVQVYNDNDTNTKPGTKEVFIKNYYLGVGPQSAYTLGIAYNSKNYWFLKLNANYLDRNYIVINPARRSVEAAELVEQNDPMYARIFDQEKLPAFYTFDLSGGKSFRMNKLSKRISRSSMLYFNFGISNLLNNHQIKSAGFEQLRYDFTNNNPDKFPNKYIYGYGRNFFASLSIKF